MESLLVHMVIVVSSSIRYYDYCPRV